MSSQLLYLFTRTPLHVGAGSSVGAIDQPIVRERHTGFPIIPASTLKGCFADQWPTQAAGRLIASKGTDEKTTKYTPTETAWLFGSDDAKEGLSAAGALQFGEARLLAFPIRSARGSFAWITCPLLLRRAVRDGVFSGQVATEIQRLNAPGDDCARFSTGKIDLQNQQEPTSCIVLEEYAFKRAQPEGDLPAGLGAAFAQLLNPSNPGAAGAQASDPVWAEVATRLVILSDGQLSYFATTACEVAQHVGISDETGTAKPGALFNQENVPSETLFYATFRTEKSRLQGKEFKDNSFANKTAAEALTEFAKKVWDTKVFQFGADATTGLGYCTVILNSTQET